MQIHKHTFPLKKLGLGNLDSPSALPEENVWEGYGVSCFLTHPTAPPKTVSREGIGGETFASPECLIKGPLGELSLYLSKFQKTAPPAKNAWFFLTLIPSHSSRCAASEKALSQRAGARAPDGKSEGDSLQLVMVRTPKRKQGNTCLPLEPNQEGGGREVTSTFFPTHGGDLNFGAAHQPSPHWGPANQDTKQINEKLEARFKTLKKHLKTAFIGVTSGFLSHLEIRGLGYRAWKVEDRCNTSQGEGSGEMQFKLGETHEHRVRMKPDLVYKTFSGLHSQKKQTLGAGVGGAPGGTEGGGQPLLMYGINKHQLFQTEARLIQLSKSPSSRGDVYKAKGVRRAGGHQSSLAKLKSGKRK